MEDLKSKIPKVADRFLRWFCAPELLEEIQGDLYESFSINIEKVGLKKARIKYLLEVIRFFNLETIRGQQKISPDKIHLAMLKNYLKISLRHFAKNKTYILINTIGLGIATACCIAAYLYLAYNLEFDSFHTDAKLNKVFKVHSQIQTKAGANYEQIQAPIPLAPEAANQIAGIEKYCRFIWSGAFIKHGEKGFRERVHFADSSFFEMFNFPLIAGNQDAFQDKNQIFLSRKLAQKLFGDQNPIGQTLSVNFQDEQKKLVTVGGVLDKIPDNSTFVYDALMRFEHYTDIQKIAPDSWASFRTPSTFFELNTPQLAASVQEQLSSFIPIRNAAKKDESVLDYRLEAFHSTFTEDDIFGSYINLREHSIALILLGVLAIMILIIACFNLTNTSIAMSTKRFKEIGIRKAIGANRREIIFQFLAETTLVMAFSIITGLILARWLILPEFTVMVNLKYGLEDLNGVNFFITLLLLLFVSSILAGVYPALFNSQLNPVSLVKGAVRVKGTNWLTRSMMSAQFCLCVIFLIAGTLFIQNIEYQDQLNFGFAKDKVIAVQIPGEKAYKLLKQELSLNPKVEKLGATASHISYSSYRQQIESEGQNFEVSAMNIGENYIETMEFNLVRGRNFNFNTADPALKNQILINEAFLELIKSKDPFNQLVKVNEENFQIIGIVNNHIDDLDRSKEPVPFIFHFTHPKQYRTMVINSKPENLEATFEDLRETWATLFPSQPLDAQFQDELTLAGYRKGNKILAKIFLFLTIMGTLLSIAGIFSLSSLNIAKRTKEIGIRKVLGASISNIMMLINKEFIIILLIAVLIGSLSGALLTGALLSVAYAHHINVSILPVILSSVIIFGAGILTTSSSIFKAAIANPVDALRNE